VRRSGDGRVQLTAALGHVYNVPTAQHFGAYKFVPNHFGDHIFTLVSNASDQANNGIQITKRFYLMNINSYYDYSMSIISGGNILCCLQASIASCRPTLKKKTSNFDNNLYKILQQNVQP
jgi:hypothetical protein